MYAISPFVHAAAQGDVNRLKDESPNLILPKQVHEALLLMSLRINSLDADMAEERENTRMVKDTTVMALCACLSVLAEHLPVVAPMLADMKKELISAHERKDWFDFDAAMNQCVEFDMKLIDMICYPYRAALNAANEGGHCDCARWLLGAIEPKHISIQTIVSAHVGAMWDVVKWAAAHLDEIHVHIMHKAWEKLVQRNYVPPDEDPLIFADMLCRFPHLLYLAALCSAYHLLAKYWHLVTDRGQFLINYKLQKRNLDIDPLMFYILKFDIEDIRNAAEVSQLLRRELRAATHLRNPALVYLLKRLPIAAGPAADIYEMCEGNLLRGVRAQRDLAYAAM